MKPVIYPRDTYRRVRFFILDGWAAAPVILVLTHLFQLWAWVLLGVSWAIFLIMEWRGYTPPQAVRYVRSWLLPTTRPPRPPHRLRRLH